LYHSLALKSDGTVWAWGGNHNGQLGNGTTTDSSIPVQVSSLSNVTAIVAGGFHSMALKSDGTMWAWGYNANGEVGNGTTTDALTPVQALSGVSSIGAGFYHSLAVKTDGTAWSWGYGYSGQLCNGSSGSSAPTSTPTQFLTGAKAAGGGDEISAVLMADGTVRTCGSGEFGELGNGASGSGNRSSTPVQVSNLSGVTAIAVGPVFGLALKSDGTVWGWGDNYGGGVGNGTTGVQATPAQTSGLSNITAIAAGMGGGISMALKSDGTVYTWGNGPLGNGTTDSSTTPVQVSGLTGVVAIGAGFAHRLASHVVPATPPTVSCGAADGMWHATDVMISCTASDSSSGLASSADANFTLYTSVPNGTETANASTNSYAVFDKAGNSTTAGPISGNKVDKKAPTVSCGVADALWHASDVSIACTASDGGSGLANAADASFSLTTSVATGTETSNASTGGHAVADNVGNTTNAGPIGGNKVDKKPPTITINQPTAGNYTHSSTLTLNYTVTDGGSGPGTVTPKMNGGSTLGGSGLPSGRVINLLTDLPLGANTFAIAASDNVGNNGSASVTFNIIVTPQSIMDDVTQFAASGDLTVNTNSLLVKLNAALAARNAGQCTEAAGNYGAFVNEVNAQTGKKITPAAAAILVGDAQYLIAHCP
jgi:alpha-tubulin suppressor-like RCC1 family protein